MPCETVKALALRSGLWGLTVRVIGRDGLCSFLDMHQQYELYKKQLDSNDYSSSDDTIDPNDVMVYDTDSETDSDVDFADDTDDDV